MKISEAKIKSFLHMEKLEELIFLLDIADDATLKKFLQHYKSALKKKKKKTIIDNIIESSETIYDMKKSLSEKLSANLLDSVTEVREKLSELRKSGHDVLIEDLAALRLKGKITLFSKTHKKADYVKIMKVIHELESKIKAIEKAEKEKTKQ